MNRPEHHGRLQTVERKPRSARSGSRIPWSLLAGLFLPPALLVAGVVGVSMVSGIPLGNFTRDPACALKPEP